MERTWYVYIGNYQTYEGRLACIATRANGPFALYNFDPWEALADAKCSPP